MEGKQQCLQSLHKKQVSSRQALKMQQSNASIPNEDWNMESINWKKRNKKINFLSSWHWQIVMRFENCSSLVVFKKINKKKKRKKKTKNWRPVEAEESAKRKKIAFQHTVKNGYIE